MSDSNTIKNITLKIGIPGKDSSSDWCCSFCIEGFEDSPMYHNAFGVDSLQALLNALEGARNLLLSLNVTMSWEGGNKGDIGIPRMVPMILNESSVNDIEVYIDQKIENFLEESKR